MIFLVGVLSPNEAAWGGKSRVISDSSNRNINGALVDVECIRRTQVLFCTETRCPVGSQS
jgi:hypothetical protein